MAIDGALGYALLREIVLMQAEELEQVWISRIARPPSFPPWQWGMTEGFRYAISENALATWPKAEPFRPFKIHLPDGRRLDVKHPEFLAYTPKGRIAVVMSVDETFEIVDLMLVTSPEISGGCDAHAGRSAKSSRIAAPIGCFVLISYGRKVGTGLSSRQYHSSSDVCRKSSPAISRPSSFVAAIQRRSNDLGISLGV